MIRFFNTIRRFFGSDYNQVDFTKIRQVKTPCRANLNDAGIDFYIPDATADFVDYIKEKNKNNDLRYVIREDEGNNPVMDIHIPAGEQVLIPSGIKVNIHNKNTFLIATNKSGIASKKHLVTGACVIDADYQGEIHINLLNVGNVEVVISTGQKATQFIHEYFIHTDMREISNEEYDGIDTSDRGEGGFGSSMLK